ncbi:hypothetical protein V8F33_004643 [Rhypophila sp. PSN 637]
MFSLISGTRSIYKSVSGASHHNETIETIVTQLQTLSLQVSSSVANYSKAVLKRNFPSNQADCSNKQEEPEADHTKDIPTLVDKLIVRKIQYESDHAFLSSLQFPDMRLRQEAVKDAHSDTFSWIFGDNEDNPATQLPTWLREGTGVFWIRGKAGSGKSTLMKYLSQNSNTLELLRTWAGNRDLSIGRYFFWYAGSKLQKSREGLIQTLLFELLRACPDAISIVRKSIAQLPPEPGRWAMSELMRATKSFVACSLQKRFCIFIDGLDEHDGDMDDLIELIEQLASSDNVKICCSSRPWPSFADAFGQKENLMLKLEDLTAGDIMKFVAASFQQHKRFSKYARDSRFSALMKEIARKAEGVFLWVTLVVKSLRDGLTNADRIVDLERRLKAMPLDLEALLWRMIESIDPFYNRKSSELLLTIGGDGACNYPALPAFLVDILDEFDDNPEALTNGVSCEILGDPADWVDTMNRKLDARTKGLVELRDSSWSRPIYVELSQIRRNSRMTVQVLHRSVLDFLSTPKVVQELARHCRPGFKPHKQVLASSLIWLLSPTIPLAVQSYSSDMIPDDDFKLFIFFSYVTDFEGKHSRGVAPMRYLRVASQQRPLAQWGMD